MQSFSTLKQVVYIEPLDFKALSVFYLFSPSLYTFKREKLCKGEEQMPRNCLNISEEALNKALNSSDGIICVPVEDRIKYTS
jgi:hypothetical protein